MPSALDLVQFDTSGWQKQETTEEQAVWRNAIGDGLILQLHQGPIDTYPSHLTALRPYMEASWKRTGFTGVEVNIQLLSGIPAIKLISKVPLPPGPNGSPRGMAYTSVWCVPFTTFEYNILCMCAETGITGMRETMVFGLLHRDNPQATLQQVQTQADDERYDQIVPDHPLTRIRGYMRQVQQTCSFHPYLLQNYPRQPLQLPSS